MLTKQMDKFDLLKIKLYLWMAPFLIIALLVSFSMQVVSQDYDLYDQIVIPTLCIWFILSWILVYKKLVFRFVEISNLLLISIMHIMKFFYVVNRLMQRHDHLQLGSLIWTPLFFIYIFFTLRDKKGLIFSIVIFIMTFLIGIFNSHNINRYLEPISMFFIANVVYIVVLYFSLHLIKVYSESEALEKMAYQDFLTTIPNRHQMTMWLKENVAKATKARTAFSVIFFDIDRFKQINDQFGHDVGDRVLVELAHVIKQHLPNDQYFARWGGDEFMILTSYEQDAVKIAEDMKVVIECHAFEGVGEVTSSFGVTSFKMGDTIENILKRADQALYQSKECGCNQVSQL